MFRCLFNPQQQFPVSWPDHPVVGLAYLDQLMRSEAVDQAQAEALYVALGNAAPLIEAGSEDSGLSRELQRLRRGLSDSGLDGDDAERLNALRDVINAVARALR